MKVRSIAYFLSGVLGLVAGLGLVYYPQKVQADIYRTVQTVLLVYQVKPERLNVDGRTLTAALSMDPTNPEQNKMKIESALKNIPGIDSAKIEWIEIKKEIPSPMAKPKTSSANSLKDAAVFFDYKKTEMRWDAQKEFINIVNILKENEGLKIEVLGYADDIGSKHYNLELSTQRAEFIRSLLIQSGIEPNRVAAKGMGEAIDEAIEASNYTDEGEEETARRHMRKVAFRPIEGEIQ